MGEVNKLNNNNNNDISFSAIILNDTGTNGRSE